MTWDTAAWADVMIASTSQVEVGGWIALVAAAVTALVPAGRMLSAWVTGRQKHDREQDERLASRDEKLFNQAVKMIEAHEAREQAQDAKIDRLDRGLRECEEDRQRLWCALRDNGIAVAAKAEPEQQQKKGEHA